MNELVFRTVVEASNEGIWVTDPTGVTTYANERMAELLGYTRDELIGRSVLEFVHEDSLVDTIDRLRRRRHGVRERYEARYERRDGSVVWARISAAPLLDDDGQTVGAVAVFTDITDAKLSQLELRRSEARFRALVENSSDMVSVISSDGTLLFHYPPDILGYHEGENLGRSAMDFIHPDDLEPAWARLSALVDTGGVSAPFEFRLRQVDGTWRWVEAVGKDLCDDPAIGGIVVNSRDVTERKRAEELERRATALARSNRELEEFAYVASHDLAAPARFIEAQARALVGSHTVDPKLEQGLGAIVRRAARMQELIDALLACARVTSDSKVEPVSLQWAFDEAVGETAGDAIVDRGPLPTVFGDRAQLVQLFANLLGNAVKFRRPDRPLEVRAWARLDGQTWIVGLDDNGVGVGAADRERVFRMFERVNGGGATPGTGIGLALCARIAERHGGRIWFDDGIDGGAGVRMAFPATA